MQRGNKIPNTTSDLAFKYFSKYQIHVCYLGFQMPNTFSELVRNVIYKNVLHIETAISKSSLRSSQ